MSMGPISLILVLIGVLGGGGLLAGGVVLTLKENRVIGIILMVLGFLLFICPLALLAYIMFGMNFM